MGDATDESETTLKTPEYMLLPSLVFKLSLNEYRDDAELKKSVLEIIEQHEMARCYEEVCKLFDWPLDENLYDEMKKGNIVAWERLESPPFDTDLDAHAKKNWREKLEYAMKIGDYEKASNIASSIFADKTQLSSNRAEAAFCLFRVPYLRNDVVGMAQAIENIKSLVEGACSSGSDWCYRNKLKVYEAIYCLAIRDFPKAAELFLDSVPTFESYELLQFKDVIRYTVLSGMVSLERSKIDSQLYRNGTLQQALSTELPQYKKYISSLFDCSYETFFKHLAWIEQQMKTDPLLRPHYRHYVREMRIRAYSQILQAYRALSLSRMANEFGVNEQYVEKEIARFISSGKLHCKIDNVAGVVITVSTAGCNSQRAPESCYDQADIYKDTVKKVPAYEKCIEVDTTYVSSEMKAAELAKKFNQKLLRQPQPYKFLLVLDFEATCDNNRPLIPTEIIEFPCVALNTGNWEIENVFHKFVKPKVHPKLTDFCVQLTGIVQENVDCQQHFPEVFAEFNKWLKANEYLTDINKSAIVTCGNWDLKTMLPAQCALCNIPVPEELEKWIDLKHIFCNVTKYYPRSLTDMLARLSLPLHGRLHSGIDDVQNMINIIRILKEFQNGIFNMTSTLTPKLVFRKTKSGEEKNM